MPNVIGNFGERIEEEVFQQPSANSMQRNMDSLMINEASEFVLIDAPVEATSPTIAELLAARTPQRRGAAKRFS